MQAPEAYRDHVIYSWEDDSSRHFILRKDEKLFVLVTNSSNDAKVLMRLEDKYEDNAESRTMDHMRWLKEHNPGKFSSIFEDRS